MSRKPNKPNPQSPSKRKTALVDNSPQSAPMPSSMSKKLADALGPKGKPMSMQDAADGANPNYHGGGKSFRNNCQRCVYAYEMRRRGYDVEALPRLPKKQETLAYDNHPKGWKHVMEGAQGVSFGSYGVQKKLEAQMAAWGDGARAVVAIQWKGSHKGHVFIAEQVNGKTVYIEPQRPNSKAAKAKGISTNTHLALSGYLDKATKKKTQLMRIDNLKPTELLADCIQPTVKQGE